MWDILLIFLHTIVFYVIYRHKTVVKKKHTQFSYVSLLLLNFFRLEWNKFSVKTSNCDTLHFHNFFLQDVRARDEEVVDEHAINHLMHDKGKVYPKLVGTPCIS